MLKTSNHTILNHLWCPNASHGEGIDDGDDDGWTGGILQENVALSVQTLGQDSTRKTGR